METNRRSSKRQQKIPTHFNDSVHDLNKKKDCNKDKGISGKNKKGGDVTSKANSEGLSEAGNKEGLFDDCVGCDMNSREEMVDNGSQKVQMEKCSGHDGFSVENGEMFTEKMKFGSVSDEMLVNNEGSHDMELPNVSTGNPNTIHKSYANIAASVESIIDNKLMSIPTDSDELGNEYVIFDEELINDGCKRWLLTLCGFFMGFKMRI
ncbi:hypothetical protein Tco_1299566, partial [Tanacetum coccineum]